MNDRAMSHRTINPPFGGGAVFDGVFCHASGRTLAGLDTGEVVELREDGSPGEILCNHGQAVTAIAISRESGKRIATGGGGTVRLWGPEGREAQVWSGGIVAHLVGIVNDQVWVLPSTRDYLHIFGPGDDDHDLVLLEEILALDDSAGGCCEFSTPDERGLLVTVRREDGAELVAIEPDRTAGAAAALRVKRTGLRVDATGYVARSSDGERVAIFTGSRVVLAGLDGANRVDFETEDAFSGSFSADGQRLLVIEKGLRLKIVDVMSRKLLATCEIGSEGGATRGAWGPDEEVVVASVDNTLMRWSARSGQLLSTLSAPRRLAGVTFSPNGRTIAVSHPDGVYLFAVDGSGMRKVPLEESSVRAPVFLDDERLAVALQTGIGIVDLQRGTIAHRIKTETPAITLSRHPRGGLLVHLQGGALVPIDLGSLKALKKIGTVDAHAMRVALSPEGTRAVLHVLGKKNPISTQMVGEKGTTMVPFKFADALAIGEDGRVVIAHDGKLVFIHGDQVVTRSLPIQIGHLAISPDLKHVVGVSLDSEVIIGDFPGPNES